MSKVYPTEIYNSIRKYKNGATKTFSADALFARGNETSPLIAPGFSRIKLSIFEQDGGVNGNIREVEIAPLYEATRACLNDYFSSREKSSDGQVPFTAGRNKGKTPAQVLLETKDQSALMKEREFLAENAAKYPQNNAVIQAIDEAIAKYNDGTLSDSSSGAKTIYHSDSRSTGSPDQEGCKKIYGIHISYMDGKFNVDIENYRAPVLTSPTGSLMVQSSQAKDKKKLSFVFPWQEWLQFVTKAHETAVAFNMVMFKNAWTKAQQMEFEQRKEYAG